MNKLGLNDLIASVRLGGALCLVVLCGVLAAGSSAQTNSTWSDTTGNWSNAANWNNGVPNGNFNALISNGNPGVATVNLDINATIANLELDTQNTLNIQAGKTLTFQSSSASTAAGGGTINVASGGTILVAGGGSLSTFSDPSSTNVNMLGASSLITGATGSESIFIPSVTGSGTISSLQVSAASIVADGGTLTIKPNSQGLQMGNFLEVTAGSTLNITGGPFKNFDPTTGILSEIGSGSCCGNGIYLQGTLKFDNANVRGLDSGQGLTLDGPGAQIVNQNNQNGLANLKSLGHEGSLLLLNGASLSTSVDLDAETFNSLDVSSGSTLSIGGSLNVSEVSANVNHGVMTVGGNINSIGGDADSTIVVTNGGTLNVHGTYTGTTEVFGTSLTISSGSTAKIGGDFNDVGSVELGASSVSVANSSSLNVGGSLNSTANAQVTISGDSMLNVGKDVNLVLGFSPVSPVPSLVLTDGSFATIDGSVNSAGTIEIDKTSTMTVKSGFNQSDGSTVVDGVLNIKKGAMIQGGTLSGTGTVNGNVTMAGMMMPGNPTGTFTLNGNYTQTSAGTLAEQVGWLNGSNANLFKVSGTASLAGTLALSLLSGYNPMVGDSFILMRFLNDTGTFSNVTGTNLGDNLVLDVIYDAHDVRVEVESASVATPEPSSNLLLLAGLLVVRALARKRFASGTRGVLATAS